MCKEWDADKLEAEIPPCMIEEWNEYLDFEMETLTRAILGTLPAARGMIGAGGGSGGGTIKLTDPEQIGGFFDALNKGN